jgi:CheY-like chemotaxis protein
MTNTLQSPKTILVIEDDSALLSAISAKLTSAHFIVITARSVDTVFTLSTATNLDDAMTADTIKATLEHLESLANVDAIWLDHNLIGADDGIDFIVKFKANGGKWSKIPIFVVSNSANPDLIKTYAEIGIHHYYLKAEHRLEHIVDDIVRVVEAAPEE